MEELKKQRKVIKSAITRILNYCESPQATDDGIISRGEKIDKYFDEFEIVQSAIENLITDSTQLESEETVRKGVEDKYYEVKAYKMRLTDKNQTIVDNNDPQNRQIIQAIDSMAQNQSTLNEIIQRMSTQQTTSTPTFAVSDSVNQNAQVRLLFILIKKVHIDVTGKLSGKRDIKEYIIVLIDAFTKYVFLHHTLNLDAQSCIKAAKYSMSVLALPSRIIADQGRCFAGKQFRDFCSSQNIELHLIATGASRANGQDERVMGTLKNLLTIAESGDRTWQDALGEIQLALNCTAGRITKVSPLEMLIGKEVRPFGLLALNNENEINLEEVRKTAESNMLKNAQYEKLRFDKNKTTVIKFKVNDFVLLKNEARHQTKLDPKFKGPFQKSLSSNRTYKYAHEWLRKLPEGVSNEADLENDN